MIMKTRIATLLVLFVLSLSSTSAKTACLEPEVELAELVSEPKKFLNKKVSLSGEFYSFSNLSLDYKPALKSSKDFIGIILARPDKKEIPLVELKLSAPLAMFKDSAISFEHGDKILMRAKVYAIALGEPWLEVESINVTKKANDATD